MLKNRFLIILFVLASCLQQKAIGDYIPDAYTNKTPSAAVFRDRLYVAFKDNDSEQIRLASTDRPEDPSSWVIRDLTIGFSGQGPAQIRTSHGPAISAFGNNLWIIFKGHNNPSIWIIAMDQSGNWTGHGHLLNAQTAKAPGIAGTLVVHRGNQDNGIWYIDRQAIPHQDKRIPAANSEDSPAVAYWTPGNQRIVVFRQLNNAIMTTRYEFKTGIGWEWRNPEPIPGAWSLKRPALAMHGNMLYVAFKSGTNKELLAGSYNGFTWNLCGTIPNAYTNEGPALVSFKNKLYVFFKGQNSDRIWYAEVPVHAFNEPFNPEKPGWVTFRSDEETCNRCAIDPVGDINNRIVGDPDYNLAYRSGNDLNCSEWAPTVRNGHMCRTRFADWCVHEDHRQSIQRLYIANGIHKGNYFLVSCSARMVGPGFEVVKLGDLTTVNFIGQTDQPGTRSLCNHCIIKYHSHDNEPYPEHYNHAGGIQVMGKYVVVPLENEGDEYKAAFMLADLSDPKNPRWGDLIYRTNVARGKSIKDAGSAAMIRLNNGLFMVMIFGKHAHEVEVFVSKSLEFNMSRSNWESKGAWETGFPGYQNTQLVVRCDGRVYLVGTSKFDNEDRIDLWRVTFSSDLKYQPYFSKEATHHMYCRSRNTGQRRFCDFGAGAGPYVDGRGHIILYSVEKWAYIHLKNGKTIGKDGNHVGVREFVSLLYSDK